MNRRNFLTFVGVGWIASSLPVAIAACASEKTSKGWQTVGTIGELDKTGQLLAKNSPVGSVLVVGRSKSSNLVAVDPTCTHKGCTVEWKGDAKKFQCPCHGAEYGADGKVLKGPANDPLKTYSAKIEGNSVLVQ
ncbi:Rieske 2Fe-2S domain-containing protein [Aetokthonos hydrillicola Thurmond2011]|jgi:cytochrome b6-f complex iron-sulfur subunit|uniref:Rieske 2Fe-2S domain-containing protein n=1 Tax=Aetokthonos hydrillicola Thurmond2011 TaxID=2712845 RepID=A0AAP5IAK8_9CYAN|nr:Rieske 2Fe-2S domain-containing protein [Aetokthonos hydrillicola]MBO3463819.1 Rieske 2Fe-2S domain-containing protein [Aetokthonos hydrillicola CCALA 1050]MBW4587647.1 Rieske 2Fe-2S domain-containing protein [Aetokthonos hydrillicola CCALA 1050]MDR9897971.1 Rieske 2Fe-2S domain-containing protein [Aetokthonos hydrillicola Thurmond2011]